MSRHIVIPIFAVAVAVSLMAGASAGSKAAPGQTPPADLTPPTISGTPQVGSGLTTSPGTWDGKGLKYAYQWLRCDTSGASCSAVGAASTSTYSLSANDVGTTLRVLVTASNRVGSAAATSSQTDAIAALPAAQPPPPPPPPPPAVSPSVTSLPTITGTVQQGQTLTGSTGTWSGTTPITYAYQWQRCDSAGVSCAPIASATGSTYLLASTDVASTMRLSVTASNSAGSATASSVATAAVTAVTSTPVTSAPLWPWASPNYTLGYATDPTSLPHWQAANSNSGSGFNASYIFTVNDGSGGSATRLKIAPTTASTTSGTMSALYSPMPDRRVTAYGSNTTASAYTAQGDDTWYRWRIRFPNGVYVPRTGAWNVNVEWHESRYGSTLTSCPTFPSSYFGVQADGTTASPGTNPRLIFHFRSGVVNSTGSGIENDFVIPEKNSAGTVKPLQYDHWYDVAAHYKWEPNNTGVFEWYVDGALQYRNLAIKTMHVFCDGSSYPNTFGVYDYQRNDGGWPSGVDYKLMNIGQTAASVGFTP